MLQSTMMTQPLTLNSLLDRCGSVFAAVEVISNTPSKQLHHTTYGDIARRARQLGSALQKAGVKPGDRVATLMWNHYAHLECYFGVPAIGAVLHTLNLRLHPDDIAYIANHAEDRILILDDILLPLYRQFADKARFERVIVLNYGGEAHEFEDYESFLASGDAAFEQCPICCEEGSHVHQWFRTGCGHCFHANCILSWVLDHGRADCPMCRADL